MHLLKQHVRLLVHFLNTVYPQCFSACSSRIYLFICFLFVCLVLFCSFVNYVVGVMVVKKILKSECGGEMKLK